MLNLKSRKGAIATLLTLGLVVIGTLITLGTSLFVSNQKTNLSSNSMAAVNCTPIRCSTGNKSYYRRGSAGDIFRNSDCTGELSYGTELNSYCNGGSTPSNTPVPTQGGGSGGGIVCEYTSSGCKNECIGGCTSSGCKKNSAGKQTYQCNSDIAPTQPSTGGGGGGYPADDSCWIVKCFEGKPNYVMYSDSLSRYEIPLSSCPNNSLYKGGGWMTIGVANRDAKLAQLGCENGNEEITLVPTKVPTPTSPQGGDKKLANQTCGYEDDCIIGYTCVVNTGDIIKPHTGGKCKKYNPSVVTPWPTVTTIPAIPNCPWFAAGCFDPNNNICPPKAIWQNESTYKCLLFGFVKCCKPSSNSSNPTPIPTLPTGGGGTNCTDADYTVLADSSCGANGWCGPKQKKYKKSSNNTCTPVSQTNSEFKCKNESSCSSNTGTYTNNCEKMTCPLGKTGEYYRGAPTISYSYYKSYGECTSNTGGNSNQQTIINAKCITTVVNLNSNNSSDSTADFQQPFQVDLTNTDLSNTQIQFDPNALVIGNDTRLSCHTPVAISLNQINQFMQGLSSVNICSANENITIIPDFSGSYPLGKPQCCPK